MEGNQNTGVVEMSRNFTVPVERLFEAWNEPEQLKQWWHPLNNHLETVKNDLKEGGVIDYEFQDHKLHITGNYQKVSRNEKLVYSWNWELADDQIKNAEYTLSIDFIAEEKGSRLQIRQEGFKDQQATQPHKEGWNQGLESLEEFLQQQGGSTDVQSKAGASNIRSGNEPVTAADKTTSDKPPVIASAYDQMGGTEDTLDGNQSATGKSADQTENQQANPSNQMQDQPGTNTENPNQENFDPAKPENRVSPEY